jgi:hypothetical protein
MRSIVFVLTKGSLFVRWGIFITLFFVGILSCFWSYTWAHREEFAQIALSRLYPSYTVSVGSIALEANGTATIQDLSFFPKDEAEPSPLHIEKIVAKASLLSWMQWTLMPSKSPLHLSSLSIHGSTEPLPPDVAHPATPFVQVDALTNEGA